MRAYVERAFLSAKTTDQKKLLHPALKQVPHRSCYSPAIRNPSLSASWAGYRHACDSTLQVVCNGNIAHTLQLIKQQCFVKNMPDPEAAIRFVGDLCTFLTALGSGDSSSLGKGRDVDDQLGLPAAASCHGGWRPCFRLCCSHRQHAGRGHCRQAGCLCNRQPMGPEQQTACQQLAWFFGCHSVPLAAPFRSGQINCGRIL